MKKILLVALAGLLCLACDRAEVVSVEKTGQTVENNAYPETRASGGGMTVQQCTNKLMANTWVLTDVKEAGISVDDTAIGNKVTFHIDKENNHTLLFDCSEHGGWTCDHTWAGGWIVSSDYGAVGDMRWQVSSTGGTNQLTITDGYLLVFTQESMTGVYTIRTLTNDTLVVDIDSYDETWTLEFEKLTFPPAGYTRVWRDEFNAGEDLNDNWEFESGGQWGNQELQYYCANGTIRLNNHTYKTASVSNSGTLKIKAYKVTPSKKTENRRYISARMYTKLPDLSWQHGYIEMRAKLPTTAGCWSAFWMLLADGPSYVMDPSQTAGEIDILEHVPNDDVNRAYFSAHSFNATFEADPDSGYEDPVTGELHSYCQDGYVANPENWHTYSMLWTEDYIRGYLDGVEYFYVPKPSAPGLAYWPFDQDYYLKLNLAIGGGWGGTPDPNFTSATYEIDYVRVYQAD